MNVGIVGYGAYVPCYRISVEEIAKVWGGSADSIKNGLNVQEKAVPAPDEDTATISVEASRNAMKRARIEPEKLGAIYVGSESHPYAVKPTATILAEALEATPNLTAADFEFACKAGTAAMQAITGLVKSCMVDYGLACGADTSQGAPGNALEYTAAAGGASFIIGRENIIANLDETLSFTTDTPDFWRRENQEYPQHGGRFTGEPAYFKHTISATENMLKKIGKSPSDFTYFIPHQPNGKFPIQVSKKLGFTKEQVEPGLLSPRIGNTYSGCVPLALSAVLDVAQPGEQILVTSYGSGAGSDSFVFTITDKIDEVRDLAPRTMSYINKRKYIDYGTYAKYRGKLKLE
jgi:hydroxymethylglutaryl-CoA synthase